MGRFSEILLASDFDRTLTDRQSAIPQANIDAILEFEAEGGAFTVATGRSVPMFRARHPLIPTNAPLILYNGAAIYDFDTGVMTDAVAIPDATDVLRDLAARFPGLLAEVQGLDYHYLIGTSPLRDGFYRDNDAPAIHATLDELPAEIWKIALFGVFRDTTVRQFFEATPEESAEFNAAVRYLNEVYGDRLVVDRAAPRIIDLQARSVTKGSAARTLAKRLDRPILACAGDAPNDLSMLSEADLAFVPGDCDEALRKQGFRTVCSCDEGAIAGIVKQLKELF